MQMNKQVVSTLMIGMLFAAGLMLNSCQQVAETTSASGYELAQQPKQQK